MLINEAKVKAKLWIAVDGAAVPQGSKNAYNRGNKIVLVESAQALAPWRALVAAHARNAAHDQGWERVARPGAIHVDVVFGFVKPKTSRLSEHTVRPDIDKLCRAILDALTQSGAVFDDDAQVVTLQAHKRYVAIDQAFTTITVKYVID